MKANKVLIIIEGILLIILGGYALTNPGASILTLALIFEWLLLFAGIAALVGAFSFRKGSHPRTSHIIDGLLLIGLALIFIFAQGPLSAAVLIYMLVFWFIFSAIIQTVVAFDFLSGAKKILTIILNILVIFISVQALFNPALATGIFAFTLAFNFILSGINKIIFVTAISDDDLL